MNWLRSAPRLVPPIALAGIALATLGVEVVALRDQWDVVQSWSSLVEAVNGSSLVLGILVVGCAAAVTAHRGRDQDLVRALPDSGVRTILGTGLVVGVVAAAVHLAIFGTLTIWGFASGLPGTPRPLPVLTVLIGLITCALFGTAVATAWRHPMAPLAAMGLWVAVVLTSRLWGGRELLDWGGVSVVLVGSAPAHEVSLLRAGWLAAAGVAIAWVTVHGRAAFRQVPFLLAVAAAIPLAWGTVDRADRGFAETAVQWTCSDGPPRVCVAQEYADRLPDYVGALASLQPYAREVGLPEPTDGYRQAVAQTPRVGAFNVDQRVNPDQLAFDLVQFSFPCSGDWDESLLQRADSVGYWLVEQAFDRPAPTGQTPTRAEARAALDSLKCPR